MSKPSKILLLGEDLQQRVFTERCLKKLGYEGHEIAWPYPYPAGRGAANQFVMEHYPRAVADYRRRRSRVASGLLVIIDTDLRSLAQIRKEFVKSLKSANVPDITADEKVVVWTPKRNIETWLHCLLKQESIDEQKEYPRFDGRQSDCHPAADQFATMRLANSQPPEYWPESLTQAYSDIAKLVPR